MDGLWRLNLGCFRSFGSVLQQNGWRQIGRSLVRSAIVAMLVWSLAACGERAGTSQTPGLFNSQPKPATTKMIEVSPPATLQELGEELGNQQPQVKILAPKPDEVLQDNTISLQLEVQDFPIFQNAALGRGPHLEVILDNQPDIAVYDLNQPLVFADLEPGTHTIRVFAVSPWDASFKNPGAYAQTTFHIFTKTNRNNPNPNQPLLTYNRPAGSYGAEPILLDFYLTNLSSNIDPENPDSLNWRIRCTINGESFTFDQWESIYLQGFKPGKNWVQLELIDAQGNQIENAFNNTVRVFNYEPNGQDILAQLTRGEQSAIAARGIIDPNYVTPPKPAPTPTVKETPSVEQPEKPVAPEPIKPIEQPEKPVAPEPIKPIEQPSPVPVQINITKPVEIKVTEPQPEEKPTSDKSSETNEETQVPPSPKPVASQAQKLEPKTTSPVPELATPTADSPASTATVKLEVVVETEPDDDLTAKPVEQKLATEKESDKNSATKPEETTKSTQPSFKIEIPKVDFDKLKNIFSSQPAASNSVAPVIQISPKSEVQPSTSATPSAEVPETAETSEQPTTK